MNYLVRRDPFSDLRTTMDRLFDEGFSRPWRFLQTPEAEASSFAVDVSETDGEIEVKAALPGLKPEDVEISVTDNILTIRGEHKEVTEDNKREYYRRELRYGGFHRSLALPVAVDADKAEASFENGVVHLRLPKAEALRPRQIKISTGQASTTTAEGAVS